MNISSAEWLMNGEISQGNNSRATKNSGKIQSKGGKKQNEALKVNENLL
jgi:hypothetical protein